MLIRRLARPLLATTFIYGGVQALRDVPSHAKAASPLLEKTTGKVRDSLPEQVPTDPETLVRIDAMVKIGAGTMLALGKFPRLASLLLAGSVVPTTLAGHPFWEISDPEQRQSQQIHFYKNLGLLGGLLISAVDTGGKPSVGYRARHTAQRARHTAHKVSEQTHQAVGTGKGKGRKKRRK
ncbi:putative membrane protein YphA (DoxX/SURF4 family) [Saccharopolyspora erythraea NRRL 2338]|uniref:DoxX n=2 Tax=Saccharopolyspora erythraea TaxID=1836 RepID=A4F627_SACEN|nr:DoxX family protein [Saccharopolyspora erythraea]EQD88004.1 DoxX family protein [Saccharopolyspora erythraea D]PFG93300.1 putative membrane protein YphA (DoxX/SURF4 family) [Saccharopolyspora erythraea NRRL 2338]QRK90145.1 DoxX family protein [Saccharopolyspora erythraea]CAL99501.1 DoxX [Saccharopolyspora erythraea NRRL 2338]